MRIAFCHFKELLKHKSSFIFNNIFIPDEHYFKTKTFLQSKTFLLSKDRDFLFVPECNANSLMAAQGFDSLSFATNNSTKEKFFHWISLHNTQVVHDVSFGSGNNLVGHALQVKHTSTFCSSVLFRHVHSDVVHIFQPLIDVGRAQLFISCY